MQGYIKPISKFRATLKSGSIAPSQCTGYRLHGVEVGEMQLSDLQNTSTAVMTADTSTGDLIYRYYVTVNCSATGGDGDYSYVVYYNDAGFDYLGHTTAVDDDGAATIELSSGSGYYYVWVEAYSDNVTATQRFIFEI